MAFGVESPQQNKHQKLLPATQRERAGLRRGDSEGRGGSHVGFQNERGMGHPAKGGGGGREGWLGKSTRKEMEENCQRGRMEKSIRSFFVALATQTQQTAAYSSSASRLNPAMLEPSAHISLFLSLSIPSFLLPLFKITHTSASPAFHIFQFTLALPPSLPPSLTKK